MEKNRGNSDSTDTANSSGDDKEKSNEKTFVNHAEIAWHEMRKRWVGDRSKRSRRTPCEPVISFNATYEDLLLSNTPFHHPIPLAEMVDFLVDFWYEEGLFD